MAKPFTLGVSNQMSNRCADPNYKRAPTNVQVPRVNVVPGLEQNRAPMISDDALPPLPFRRDPVPFRLR